MSIVRKVVAYITRNRRIPFSFFWVDRTNVPEEVYPGHDVFLSDVLARA